MKLKEIIKQTLVKHEKLRDDDQALIANIWQSEIRLKGFDPHLLSGFDVLKMVGENKLPSSDTITRLRRNLQEKHVELRGANYEARKAKQTKVKEILGYVS